MGTDVSDEDIVVVEDSNLFLILSISTILLIIIGLILFLTLRNK